MTNVFAVVVINLRVCTVWCYSSYGRFHWRRRRLSWCLGSKEVSVQQYGGLPGACLCLVWIPVKLKSNYGSRAEVFYATDWLSLHCKERGCESCSDYRALLMVMRGLRMMMPGTIEVARRPIRCLGELIVDYAPLDCSCPDSADSDRLTIG